MNLQPCIVHPEARIVVHTPGHLLSQLQAPFLDRYARPFAWQLVGALCIPRDCKRSCNISFRLTHSLQNCKQIQEDDHNEVVSCMLLLVELHAKTSSKQNSHILQCQ